jgi:hypothetical protein
LQSYLPTGSANLNAIPASLRVHLTITRERKSILGDYRHATHDRNHRISVNGNSTSIPF